MSRLQNIENALREINDTVFQELCDSYLAIRNQNYAALARVGSQSGKQKTVLGTPDSLILLPSGKYLFVEYSTNITKGVAKLKEDIEKCLDTKKTGIAASDILEIIICINFNLNPAEIEMLRGLLKKTRIQLTIVSLDSLAIELHLHHRDLAHHYLKLPLDTGQVVSIDRFIDEYDRASKSIATPLDNVFVHREKELEQVKTALENADFLILTGPPGIGKTRLVIEAIRHFLQGHADYNAYAISYKNFSLLDDLYQYIDLEKNYLLFVDDANRIDAFSQITGFYKANRTGQLKVIITVRDYAYQEIGRLCQDLAPVRIDLTRLTDEMIADIIKSDSFKIYNNRFQKEIIRIADGNPRLAIMTAKLANAEQDIQALYDVSDLFEKYFSTFVKDQQNLTSAINIKCLGLIGFFYTLPYKDREVIKPILQHFDIAYDEFVDVIDEMDKLELVEIQYEHVKIPEQNLAIYFFYRAFIKDELLSFAALLEHYFQSNRPRFRECVISANNTFGPLNVMDKLRPALIVYWNQINGEGERAFDFLNLFWFYLQMETMEFLIDLIAKLPSPEVVNYQVTYEMNAFSYGRNKIIELLGEYFRSNEALKDALAIAFRYVSKLPEHLPELIHEIRERLKFDWRDEQYGFYRQEILFDFLISQLDKDTTLYPVVFFELAKSFMAYKFQHTEGGRNHSIAFYLYPIPDNGPIRAFREKIWKTVDNYFALYPDLGLSFLQSYAHVNPDVESTIMAGDIQQLIAIINRHLTPESFEHCAYVQDQVRWCKRMDVNDPAFDDLAVRFSNPLYRTYLKVDWNRLRDKEMFEFDDYRQYEVLKEQEIRQSFLFENTDQVQSFYQDFLQLKSLAKNDWSYNNTLEFVIDENFKKEFALGLAFYQIIIDGDNEAAFVPRFSLRNQLDTSEKAAVLWRLFNKPFKHSINWKLSFFDFLNDSLVNADYTDQLLQTINSIDTQIVIHFEGLKKYQQIDPHLFQKILAIIVAKNDQGIAVQTWMDFFNEYFDTLGDDLALIKTAYLHQYALQNHFDFEAKALKSILTKDPAFLLEFITYQFKDREFGSGRDHRGLNFIWNIPGIEPHLHQVFELFIKKGHYYGILETYLNAFFQNLNEDQKPNADEFLLHYVKEHATDPQHINLVVDIVRHSRKELFDQVLLDYISLNQNAEDFAKIWWRGNGGSYSGNVIIGDIEAAQWKNILAIVERSDVGIDLIPIKKQIIGNIEHSLEQGDWERKRRFLERDY